MLSTLTINFKMGSYLHIRLSHYYYYYYHYYPNKAYAPVRDAIGAGNPDSPVYMKFFAGALTGAIGSVAG